MKSSSLPLDIIISKKVYSTCNVEQRGVYQILNFMVFVIIVYGLVKIHFDFKTLFYISRHKTCKLNKD